MPIEKISETEVSIPQDPRIRTKKSLLHENSVMEAKKVHADKVIAKNNEVLKVFDND